MKSFYKSKTLWFNALALGIYVARHYYGLTDLPTLDPVILALVNFILRLVTTQPVKA